MTRYAPLVFFLLLTNLSFGDSSPKPGSSLSSLDLPVLPKVHYTDLGNGEVKASNDEIVAKELAEAKIKMIYAQAMRESAAMHRASAKQLDDSTATLEADRLQKIADNDKLKSVESHLIAQQQYGAQMKSSQDKILMDLNATNQALQATRGELQQAWNSLGYTQQKIQQMTRTSWIPIVGPLINMMSD